MGGKKEKQIERSKDAITEALIDLLKSHSMEQITITQLCSRAGVGRPTFYRHFDSKKDVLAQQNQKWFHEYLEKARAAYEENPSAEIMELVAFEFYRDHEHVMNLVKTKNFYRYGVAAVASQRRRVEKEFPLFNDKNPYEREYRIGGMIFVFSRWISGGMKETPEEMAAIFSQIYGGMGQDAKE